MAKKSNEGVSPLDQIESYLKQNKGKGMKIQKISKVGD